MEGRQDAGSAGLGIRNESDLVLLAMGFTQPLSPVLEAFGVDKDARGNVRASTEGDKAYYTSVDKCSPRAICGAGSRWWYGRSAKDVSARARSTLI